MRLIWDQPHGPESRIWAYSGETRIGRVYPLSDGRATWHFYLDRDKKGQSRSVIAAKNDLADAFSTWMQRTRLQCSEAQKCAS